MSKKKGKYDVKSVKEIVLINSIHAYYLLGQVKGNKFVYKEEILKQALFKVLDDDTGSREQFVEFMGLSYMVQAIIDKLQVHLGVKDVKFEDIVPF